MGSTKYRYRHYGTTNKTNNCGSNFFLFVQHLQSTLDERFIVKVKLLPPPPTRLYLYYLL